MSAPGKDQVNEAAKGGKGGGTYFPLTAVQRWDSNTMQIENGVYLGQIAALTFRGPFAMSGVRPRPSCWGSLGPRGACCCTSLAGRLGQPPLLSVCRTVTCCQSMRLPPQVNSNRLGLYWLHASGLPLAW